MTAQLKEGRPRSKRACHSPRGDRQIRSTTVLRTHKWATIADEVGIGQTALYHYFESKAHCLLTIMNLELDRSCNASSEVTAGVTTTPNGARRRVASAYDVSPREALQMRILQNHMDLLATPRPSEKEESERQKARKLVREIEEEWTALLARGMARHVPEAGRARPGDRGARPWWSACGGGTARADECRSRRCAS